MASTSCNVPNPIVNWGGGTAPTLKYNLPQGTTLTPAARIPISVPTSSFLAPLSLVPRPNFWDDVASLPIDNLGRDIVTDILQNVNNSKFVKNIQAVTLSPLKNMNTEPLIKTESTLMVKSSKSSTVSKSKYTKLNYKAGEDLPTIELGGKEISVDYLVRAMKEGMMPVARRTFSGSTRMEFVRRPVSPKPRLYVIEEYRINSYLGDYGAGKILKTMTLLPGEKTTITMRTFKQINSKQTMSQNVLESVSEEVVDSLESFVQMEAEHSMSSAMSSSSSFNADVSVGADLGVLELGADVGYESSSSIDQSRANSVNMLQSAMDKHTAQSNTNREININNSTEDSSTEETEETIVRQLENVNYSRVLNFVFRQMQQQYISVTTLNNIKIVFTNGYPESVKIVGIEKLHELLEAVIIPAEVENVYEQIINQYCKVRNYDGDEVQFLTNQDYSKEGCIGSPTLDVDYWTANNAVDTFDFLGSPFQVPGVILGIKNRTLQTDSVVCDALLGQMDALDCYNMKKQDADAARATTESEMIALYKYMMETATGEDKIELAKIIGRLMTKCCDVPQSSGCGCNE